jgi:chitodextrinase
MLIASIGLFGCGEPEPSDESGTDTGSTGSPATAQDQIAPSTPTGLAAAVVSPSQINLSWSPSTDNVAVTGHRVYRNGVLLATLEDVIAYQDTTLSASTTYSYTLLAFDGSGNASAQSPAVIASTPATLDTIAPSTPTGLAANAVSAFQVDLSWSASTDNVAVTGYSIVRNGQPLVTVGNVTTHQDVRLFAGNTYIYTIRALDGAGNASGVSSAASATTPAVPDTTAPTTPGNLTGNAVSPSQINLSWSASTDNFGVVGYRVYRNGALLISLVGNVTTYQNTGLTPSTTYSYNVDAIDAASNVSGLSTPAIVTTPATPDTSAPSTPIGLTANAVSPSRIDLSWSASTDNVAVTGYRVLRNGTLLITLGNVTTYQDAGLTASTTYSYAIRALDAAGNVSNLSTSASATTQAAPDTVAPSIPAGLTATAASASQINLSWSASTDNVAVTGYRLYRNGIFLIALGSVTTFQNTGLTASTTYSYNVDAVDAAGNASGVSTVASATTQASGGTPGTPSISGVSGTFSQGQSITIAGSSFGSKSHAGPMLWDDFDSGASGSAVAGPSGGTAPLIHQGNLASYNEWVRDGGGDYLPQSVVFNSSSPKANSSLHARMVFTNADMWGLNLYVPYSQFTTGNELYISFYYRMSKIGAVPFPRQIKPWIAYNSSWNDKAYWNTAYDNCQAGGYRMHITENSPDFSFSLSGTGTEGEWVRFESYLKQSSPGGSNGHWRAIAYRPTLGTPAKASRTLSDVLMRTSSDNWTRWTFGGGYYSMCNPGDNGTVDVDEFYMDSTQARVEVCNAPTLSASTKCELQIPMAWSDTSITATFKKGYISSASTAYVYVINASGSVNAAGHAITIP